MTKRNGKIKKSAYLSNKNNNHETTPPEQEIKFSVKSRSHYSPQEEPYKYDPDQKLLHKIRVLGTYILTGDVNISDKWVKDSGIEDYLKLYSKLIERAPHTRDKVPIKPQCEDGKLIIDNPNVISKILPPYQEGKIVYYTKTVEEDGEVVPAGSINFEAGISCKNYGQPVK